MVDPALALLIFAAVAALATVVLWPKSGVLARWTRGKRQSGQVLLEDALKHVFTCERVGRVPTIESVAGQLEVSTGKAADVLARLAQSGLISATESGLHLTERGRESALRVVRAHRLWERYLADRTGVPATEWHAEAEDKEHSLSPEEADTLASKLGNPSWDPHGDPIPTPLGELPDIERLNLTGVTAGCTVEITHLEDEPREIYESLLADGLGLGMKLDVVERTDQAVRLRARGREWQISIIAARNVSVRVVSEPAMADEPVETLLDLSPGESGSVVDISPACQGTQRRRLLDLGVVKGTEIQSEFRSAAGDPVAYRIRGALIALRSEQAEWIRIEKRRRPEELAS